MAGNLKSGSLTHSFFRKDDGFTLIEIITVIILTSLLSGIFAQTLIQSLQIYTDHNLRKTSHIDFRRSFDMVLHDGREWEGWFGAPTSSQIYFNKYNRFYSSEWFYSGPYYSNIRVGYIYTGGNLNHQRNETSWATQYPLITGSINMGNSSFSTVTEGGVFRIVVNTQATVNNKPMRMRTAVFPRWQGR